MTTSTKNGVLTINGGSSGIKFSLYKVEESLSQLLFGEMESIGTAHTKLTFTDAISNQKNSINITGSDPGNAIDYLIDWLQQQDNFGSVKAIGHRIVHGMKHTDPQEITPELLNELRMISSYDPEHLPQEIKLIEVFKNRLPEVKQVACFDTSFHTSMATGSQIIAHSAQVS